ncbi:MAG: hypothetical protein ACFFDR_11635 [Candidatus Thorarchaeota archaeon]
MRKSHPVQTRLVDFEERPSKESSSDDSNHSSERVKRPPARLWGKTISGGEIWGVFEVDDTVLFVQIINDRINAHGREAVCKYCGGALEIRDTQVFCEGDCGVYQGNFSYDLNAYLQWDGAKSLTLRKEIAETEGLTLEDRDLESISYAPLWSQLYDYEEYDDSDLEME